MRELFSETGAWRRLRRDELPLAGSVVVSAVVTVLSLAIMPGVPPLFVVIAALGFVPSVVYFGADLVREVIARVRK